MAAGWRDHALCAGTSSRYYDPWDVPDSMWDVPSAIMDHYCGRCPVRLECLIEAFKHNDCCIRGGTTKRQRDALRRPRVRDHCPVCKGRLTHRPDQFAQVCASCGLSWRAQ